MCANYSDFASAVFRLSRARPIRFKKLSIAVSRAIKRAEVPGVCYVPTMRILRLRLCRESYAIPSRRTDIPDSAAAVHPHERDMRILFLSPCRRALSDESILYCIAFRLRAINQLNTTNRVLLTIFSTSFSSYEKEQQL